MVFRRTHTSALILVTVLALVSGVWAGSSVTATSDAAVAPAAGILTVTIKGTLGPILSGSDPLGLNGDSGTVTIKASEGLSPIKHTSNSATYKLPAGAITVVAGSHKFKTTSSSTMTFTLESTADIVTLNLSGPDGLQVTDTTFLKAGSFSNAVLKHPTVFKPSPQNLTSATKSNGPGCKVKYTIPGSTTVLGFKGTASNKQTANAMQ